MSARKPETRYETAKFPSSSNRTNGSLSSAFFAASSSKGSSREVVDVVAQRQAHGDKSAGGAHDLHRIRDQVKVRERGQIAVFGLNFRMEQAALGHPAKLFPDADEVPRPETLHRAKHQTGHLIRHERGGRERNIDPEASNPSTVRI